MNTYDNQQIALVRLGDAEPAAFHSLTKLRGHIVFGVQGKQIGEVTDFYVDPVNYPKSYLLIELDGSGSDDQMILLPPESIVSVAGSSIHIKESRENVLLEPKIDHERARMRFLVIRIPRASMLWN